MRQRVLSAAVLVPVVAGVYVAGQPWVTVALALLAGAAAWEAFRLLRAAGVPASPGVGLIGAPVAVLLTLLPGRGSLGLIALVVVVVVAAALLAFRHADMRVAFLDWTGSVFGAVYVSLLAFVAIVLEAQGAAPLQEQVGGRLDAGRLWLLVLVLGVWTYDTAAYVSGRAIGRGPFMRHISPAKTWSGVVGGTVACIVVTVALVATAPGLSLLAGAVLGLLVAVAAQTGDLAESVLKRAAGVKDSGAVLPGHGGVLDRIDSFLFAAPAFVVAMALLLPAQAPLA